MQKQKWKKLGLVYKPDPSQWWTRSHAMVPTPEHLNGSEYKIYFAGRDDKNRSHIGYVIIDMDQPTRILEHSPEPVLAPGDLGCFDDNGVTPSCVVKNRDETLLYYIGWNPGSTVRMHLFGGLAISHDGGKSFNRFSRAPILERCPSDPFLNTAPFVIRNADTDWTIYYVSGYEWINKDLPRYNIKMAKSVDGKHWRREGHVCIDFSYPGENALARPFVVKSNDQYEMWFSHKGDNYQLAYATSEDGVRWQRHDDVVDLKNSSAGWDQEMICYGALVPHNDQKFMFYNGNRYGFDGFGLAVLDQ